MTRLTLDRAALWGLVLTTIILVALGLRPSLHMISINDNEGRTAYDVRKMLHGRAL